MTKNFCDICGQPAVDLWQEAKMEFPSLGWYGNKSESGSTVSGQWIPFVTVRPVFDMVNHKSAPQRHHPDLCANCVACLLTLLLEKAHALIAPPVNPVDLGASTWPGKKP